MTIIRAITPKMVLLVVVVSFIVTHWLWPMLLAFVILRTLITLVLSPKGRHRVH